MYVVRNVFRAKPGQAKALVAKFKAAQPLIEKSTAGQVRLLTDVSAGFWTVVVENTTDNLNEYLGVAQKVSQEPEIGEAMKGYMDLIESGYREIFKVE
ncbi:MAG: hypothetical protein HRF49_01010 [bacterium]|jgi:pyruvate kinase